MVLHIYCEWCKASAIQNRRRTIFLTLWGEVTHIGVSKLTIIGSDNDLSPGWRKAIIWTNAGISLIEPLEINLSEILIEIYICAFTKMHVKMSSGKWRPFHLGLNMFSENGKSRDTIQWDAEATSGFQWWHGRWKINFVFVKKFGNVNSYMKMKMVEVLFLRYGPGVTHWGLYNMTYFADNFAFCV